MGGGGGGGGDGGATIGADFGVVNGQFTGAATGGTGTSIGGAPSGSVGGVPGGTVAGNVSTGTPATTDQASETIQRAVAIVQPMPFALLYGASKGLQALGAEPTDIPNVGEQVGPVSGGGDTGGGIIDRKTYQALAGVEPVVEVPEVDETLGEEALAEQAELDELNRMRRLIGAQQAVVRGEWELGRLEDLGLRDSVLMDPAERFMQKRSALERKYGLPPYYGAAR